MTDNDEEKGTEDHNPQKEVTNNNDDEDEILAYHKAKKAFEEINRRLIEKGIKDKAEQEKQPEKDDDEDDKNMILVAEEVDLSFLDGGYDWRIHFTEILRDMACNNTNNIDRTDPVILPYDLFNTQLGINESMAINYCKYLEITDITEQAIDIKKSYIEVLKKNLSKTIITVIHKFWFDICNKLGLTHGKNRSKVYDTKTLRLAIQQCSKFSQCKKLMTLFYLVFDHKALTSYQHSISKHVETIHNVTFIVPQKVDFNRQRQHCLISLISHELNSQRNIIVGHAMKTLGLKFQLKREKGTVKPEDRILRKKGFLYPYMIKGNLVSRLFILF